MTEEGLPPTFFSILIFKTYARSSSFTTSVLLMLLACYTTFLASLASWITSVAVTHLQSLTTGLWLGTRQFTYFPRLSASNIFALNSCLCNNSKIRLFLHAEKCCLVLEGFLFSNTRWLFDNFQLSKQSVSVTLQISLSIRQQLLCGNFFAKTDDY
jgi:hypothetical protein